MEFGTPKTPEEQKVIKMTREQFNILANGDVSNENLSRQLVKTAHELGLSFEMGGGKVRINVDGEEMTMCTRREDFGTIFNEEKDGQ